MTLTEINSCSWYALFGVWGAVEAAVTVELVQAVAFVILSHFFYEKGGKKIPFHCHQPEISYHYHRDKYDYRVS